MLHGTPTHLPRHVVSALTHPSTICIVTRGTVVGVLRCQRYVVLGDRHAPGFHWLWCIEVLAPLVLVWAQWRVVVVLGGKRDVVQLGGVEGGGAV